MLTVCGLPSLRSGSSSGGALLVDPRPGYHFFCLFFLKKQVIYDICGAIDDC